jgi:hypothetical protein
MTTGVEEKRALSEKEIERVKNYLAYLKTPKGRLDRLLGELELTHAMTACNGGYIASSEPPQQEEE